MVTTAERTPLVTGVQQLMSDNNNSAVVTERDSQYHVHTHRNSRGSFDCQADAQLWALTIATLEPDISTATLLSGLIVTP
jgi:hypothetical protein